MAASGRRIDSQRFVQLVERFRKPLLQSKRRRQLRSRGARERPNLQSEAILRLGLDRLPGLDQEVAHDVVGARRVGRERQRSLGKLFRPQTSFGRRYAAAHSGQLGSRTSGVGLCGQRLDLDRGDDRHLLLRERRRLGARRTGTGPRQIGEPPRKALGLGPRLDQLEGGILIVVKVSQALDSFGVIQNGFELNPIRISQDRRSRDRSRAGPRSTSTSVAVPQPG